MNAGTLSVIVFLAIAYTQCICKHVCVYVCVCVVQTVQKLTTGVLFNPLSYSFEAGSLTNPKVQKSVRLVRKTQGSAHFILSNIKITGMC